MRTGRSLLWVAACAVAAAACLPVVYVAVRASDAPAAAWRLFLSARTAALLLRTLGLATIVTALGAALALPLAWLTTRTTLPGRRFWTVALCVPLAVPSFVFGYVLLAAFGRGGLCDTWGLPSLPVYGFWGSTLALTLSTFPFPLLSFRAALLKEDPSLIEAAQSLGASPRRAFLRVTLPRLMHALRSGGLVAALYVLSDFGAVSLLQYDTFSRAIYVQLEGAFDRSLAALWSLGLMVLAAPVLALAEAGGGAPGVARARARHPTKVAQLGALALPALLFTSMVVAVAVMLPLGVIGVWSSRAVTSTRLSLLATPALGAASIAALSAIATVACALPLGLLSAWRPSRATRALTRASYASFALPPIVVALSLVSFGLRVAPVLYGTMAVLVFAHVVRFLPQALGPVRGAFFYVSPRVVEAGASLGRPPHVVARAILLPLVRPGLVAGTTLVFLTVMKELPATLLLAPIGFETLATRIWSATAEGRFAEAAPPALALVALSSLSVWWALRRETEGAPRDARQEPQP